MDGPEHGRVGIGNESERGQVDTEEEEGRVFPPSGPRLVDVEGHAHPVVSVEGGAEVMEPHDGQQSQHDADEPSAAHGRVGSLQSALAEGQRVHDADVAVQRDDAEGQHGHFRGQRAEDAGHVTLAAVTPLLVVQDVLPAELYVLGADHHQVDAHQHIGQAEVLDEEGVDLVVLAQQEAAEEDEGRCRHRPARPPPTRTRAAPRSPAGSLGSRCRPHAARTPSRAVRIRTGRTCRNICTQGTKQYSSLKVAYLGNSNETTDAFSGVMEYLGKGNERTNKLYGIMEYLDKGNETTDTLYGVMEYLDKGNETMELERTDLGKGTHLSDET